MRGGRAERGDVVRAVDARPVEDAHPARLQRVVGRPTRNRLPGEIAGPIGVRDTPGGVDRLVFDVVDASRRVEANGAHCDGVGLGELQVLPQAELEVRAIDGEVDGVLLREVSGGDLGLDLLDFGLHRPVLWALDRLPQRGGSASAWSVRPGAPATLLSDAG